MQFAQPPRQITALDIAVFSHGSPSRDESERDDLILQKSRRRVVDRFLQIQQAKVVLTAFANHGVGATLGRVGPDARDLSFDLTLQMPGKSAYPDGAFVLFCPKARGGEVAKGLACPGSCFSEDQMRVAFGLARRECGGGGAGVIGLSGTLLRMLAQDTREARAGFGLRNGKR